jgi:holin-like protein
LARQLLTIANRLLAGKRLSIIRDLGGLALIISSFIAGAWIAQYFRLPIPGGVMGMIIMLCLLRSFVIRADFVRGASAGLLYLLPVFFVPLYVEPFSDWAFWGQYGTSLLPLVIVGAAATLFLTYLLASRILRR